MNLSYKVFITHSSSPENEVSPYKQRTPVIPPNFDRRKGISSVPTSTLKDVSCLRFIRFVCTL